MNKIESIFIQSCFKEIEDGRLKLFLDNSNHIFKQGIPCYLFLDYRSKDHIETIIDWKLFGESKIIIIDDSNFKNPISKCFYDLITYKVENYKNILLLESDVKVLPDFLEVINIDISKLGFWIYGSHYYGNHNWVIKCSCPDLRKLRKEHMNGVAVYNRNEDFLKILENLFIIEDGINDGRNYDWMLSQYMTKTQRDKFTYDSNYIVNLSTMADIDVDYKLIKPKARIIHKK